MKRPLDGWGAVALTVALTLPIPVLAQTAQPASEATGQPVHEAHAGHAAHGQAPQQQSAPGMQGMDTGTTQATRNAQGGPMQMGGGRGMSMGPMQGGSPPPDARDPNAYAEGTARAGLGMTQMQDNAAFGRLLVNNLEWANSRDEHGQSLDAEAWYGRDYDKAWLKAEGDRRNGRLESLRTEALWDHAVAPFWSTQLGLRHDTGGGARNWLAFGVQGLAPYWFETEATAYVGSGGQLAARFEAKYELLFTQRLILQPRFEANVYRREDRHFGNGAGLSDLHFALRLRYEFRRQFAPYIGVQWNRRVGGAGRQAQQSGKDRQTVETVAGVRFWF